MTIPTAGIDCGFGLTSLVDDTIWNEPPGPTIDPMNAAIRMKDSASLQGNGHIILSTAYQASTCAIVRIDGDRTRVEHLRFSNARYGIATPVGLDIIPKSGHVFYDIDGSASDRCFRVAGDGTRLEKFRFQNIKGSTADSESMAFAVEFLGAAPVAKNGSIYNLSPIDLPGGLVAEGVGLSFSNNCNGGFAEDIQIANPMLLQSTIGVWVGGNCQDIVLRNITVQNMGIAFDLYGSGILENCTSLNCPSGLDNITGNWKRRNCVDAKLIDGTWMMTVYND